MPISNVPAVFRRLLAALILAAATAFAAPAQAREETYVFEGFHFDAADYARYREGVERIGRGLSALERGDWATAERECSAAYGTFIDIRLPEMGEGVRVYNTARSCMADAHAARGNWDRACPLYKRANYDTFRIKDPRAQCSRYAPDDDATLANHSRYARTFATFGQRQAELSALPEGPSRLAVAERMFSDCQALGNFEETVPPAIAAAGYCFGIVLIERGNTRKACEVLWLSARNIKSAMAKPMMEVQRQHGRNVQDNLESLRPYCTDEGYRWPAFDQAWPY